MKFKYKKIASGLIRPIIPINISAPNKKQVTHEVLVDSGADGCVFDAEVGEMIGLNIKRGKVNTVQGVTGKSQRVYMHKIILGVGGHEVSIEAGFMYRIPWEYGFVGQRGFFSNFIVAFDYRKEIIELKPKFEIN